MALALVSFDLDGTLVDTAGEIAEAANRALQQHGLPRQPEAQLALLIGHGAHALMRKLLARLQARVDEAAVLDSFDRHYADTTGTTGQPYPGAAEALDLLRSRGLRLACVTNKELRHTRRLLQHHRLHDRFDLVIGGDSLPQKKPDAAVLRHVSAALGAPLPAVAHVGDSATDVEAARNAGVRAWAVPYGYNAGRPIAEAGPDMIFPDLLAAARAALAPPPWPADGR
jgi:phosphoglycolate phosphatase